MDVLSFLCQHQQRLIPRRKMLNVFPFMSVWIQPFQILRWCGCFSNHSDWLSEVARSFSAFVPLWCSSAADNCLSDTSSNNQAPSSILGRQHWQKPVHAHERGVDVSAKFTLVNTKMGSNLIFLEILLQCCCPTMPLTSIVAVSLQTTSGISIKGGKKNKWGGERVAGMCTEWKFEVDKMYCGLKKRKNTHAMSVAESRSPPDVL